MSELKITFKKRRIVDMGRSIFGTIEAHIDGKLKEHLSCSLPRTGELAVAEVNLMINTLKLEFKNKNNIKE